MTALGWDFHINDGKGKRLQRCREGIRVADTGGVGARQRGREEDECWAANQARRHEESGS
jgi:hypothetical protein